MNNKENLQILKRLFNKERVIKGPRLLKALGTRSRMTLYRHLQGLKYLCSYSQRGIYYTCERSVKFNSNGIWRWGDVHFSRHGTLRATLIELINKSAAGYFQRELRKLVSVPVQDSLLALLRRKKIFRVAEAEGYLYVSVLKACREKQLKKRREQKPCEDLPKEVVIEILAEIIRVSGETLAVAAAKVVQNLRSKGRQVSQAQVEQVMDRYEIKKKRFNATGCY